jgi:peptide deformylase
MSWEAMSIRRIYTSEDPVLRQKAKKVKKIEASTQKLIDDMIETMNDAPGVGLAAPQVGVSLRVIVVETPDDEDDPDSGTKLQLINPEIVKSDGEQDGEEGCLSIPGYVGMVKRKMNVTVKGTNRKGKEVKVNASGYLARILQHEIDHIDGILFTDRLDSPEQLFRLGENKERIPVFRVNKQAILA